MTPATDRNACAGFDPLERARTSFQRHGLMTHLGAYLDVLTDGHARVVLPNRPEVSQQNGFVHAGATSAIADTAGGYAAYTKFPEGSDVLTVEYKLNLLAPAAGDRVEAEGTVLRAGRTLTVCELRAYAVSDGDRTLVAVGQQTLICTRER